MSPQNGAQPPESATPSTVREELLHMRAVIGQIGDLTSSIAETSGDPLSGLSFGMGMLLAAVDRLTALLLVSSIADEELPAGCCGG